VKVGVLCSILFTHSRSVNEMFIFNGKSYLCNSTFTNVYFPVSTAVSKGYLRNKQIIFDALESQFSQIYWLNSSFKLVNFSRSYTTKRKGCFFENSAVIMQYDILASSLLPLVSSSSTVAAAGTTSSVSSLTV